MNICGSRRCANPLGRCTQAGESAVDRERKRQIVRHISTVSVEFAIKCIASGQKRQTEIAEFQSEIENISFFFFFFLK
jgi:hypothetical protein